MKILLTSVLLALSLVGTAYAEVQTTTILAKGKADVSVDTMRRVVESISYERFGGVEDLSIKFQQGTALDEASYFIISLGMPNWFNIAEVLSLSRIEFEIGRN